MSLIISGRRVVGKTVPKGRTFGGRFAETNILRGT